MPTLDLLTQLVIETIVHSLQTLLLFGFAALLWFYFTAYERAYLRYWSFACLAYGCTELIRSLLTAAAISSPATVQPWSTPAQSLALTLQYLAILYSAIGANHAIRQSLTRPFWRRCGYTAVFIVGASSYFWFTPDFSASAAGTSSGLLTFLIPAFLFLGIGLPMWHQLKEGIGARLIAAGFLLLSVKNFAVAGTQLSMPPTTVSWVVTLQGILIIIFLAIVMFGIIIWLLESERSSSIRALQQAEYLHTHDALTGVSNRAQLTSKIPLLTDFCRTNNRQLIFCLVGISHFKSINENLGIKGGDLALKTVARRLQRFHQTPLAVARISGDVFAVLFDHLKSRRQICELGLELQKTLTQTITVNDRSINLAAGVGISRYPQHGSTAEGLLNKATIALTESKKRHQPEVTFFERGMDDLFAQLMDLEPSLKQAFKEDEFVLHLQPQFDFDHQQLCGFEALIRWQHPQRGLLSPGEFIPYIEQLGLTDTLDTWVLEKAAAILQSWQQKFAFCWPIAVNLSAQQFQHFDLVDQLQNIIKQYQIEPGHLELEITETVAMSDLSNGMSVINKLREKGFTVAIDDFGTGHSSLAYLRSLPISKIKIDRSFVSQLQINRTDATILKAMIRLAHGLGKRVIAEGIETEEQQNILQQLGCDMMQGYFYSPAMRLELAEQMITAEIEAGRQPLNHSLATAEP